MKDNKETVLSFDNSVFQVVGDSGVLVMARCGGHTVYVAASGYYELTSHQCRKLSEWLLARADEMARRKKGK